MSSLLTMYTTAQDEFIAKTEEFIVNNEAWLQSTINSIGWTPKGHSGEIDRPDLACCPVNPEHRMPAQSIETHVVKCEKKHGTYPDISDLDLIIDPCLSSVLERERDQITNQSNRVETSKEQASSSLTLAELLQAERDAKRRRAAHRGKRVHSNKKSYNEVMREVIANQMQTLSDTTENEGNIDQNSNSMIQESNTQKTHYSGVGEPYFRGNPHKRWLTIEQEEKDQMEKMQMQSIKYSYDKRREERSSRNSRSDRDHHSLYREDLRRPYKHDYDYKKNESKRQRDHSEDRVQAKLHSSRSYHKSRNYDFSRGRSKSKNRDLIDEKYVHSEKTVDYKYKKPQESCENDLEENLEVRKSEKFENHDRASTSERKRKHEESEEFSGQQKRKHKKNKKKKTHKHKKKSRRSSSSS